MVVTVWGNGSYYLLFPGKVYHPFRIIEGCFLDFVYDATTRLYKLTDREYKQIFKVTFLPFVILQSFYHTGTIGNQ